MIKNRETCLIKRREENTSCFVADDKRQTVPVRLGLCAVVIGVAATFVLSLQTVGDSVAALRCLYAAPWWRTGELTYWAAAWTGGGGRLSSCRRTISQTVSKERVMIELDRIPTNSNIRQQLICRDSLISNCSKWETDDRSPSTRITEEKVCELTTVLLV